MNGRSLDGDGHGQRNTDGGNWGTHWRAEEIRSRLDHLLLLDPPGLAPFVNARGHGRMKGVVAAIQHFVAGTTFNPLEDVFTVDTL